MKLNKAVYLCSFRLCWWLDVHLKCELQSSMTFSSLKPLFLLSFEYCRNFGLLQGHRGALLLPSQIRNDLVRRMPILHIYHNEFRFFLLIVFITCIEKICNAKPIANTKLLFSGCSFNPLCICNAVSECVHIYKGANVDHNTCWGSYMHFYRQI